MTENRIKLNYQLVITIYDEIFSIERKTASSNNGADEPGERNTKRSGPLRGGE